MAAAVDEDQVEVDVETKGVRAQTVHLSWNIERGPPRLFGRRKKARRRRHRCVAGPRESKTRNCRVQKGQDQEKYPTVLTVVDFPGP